MTQPETVKRLTMLDQPAEMVVFEDGEYVTFEDYSALRAECERLMVERDEQKEDAKVAWEAVDDWRGAFLALREALRAIRSQCAGHADEFSQRVWKIASDAVESALAKD